MTIDEKIKNLDSLIPMEEQQFYELVIMFRDFFLESKDYDKNRSRHRNPKKYLQEILQISFNTLAEISRREAMRDIRNIEGRIEQGYVYTRVRLILEANKGFNLYYSIKEYCRITNKDFNTIALLMAEYRGVDKIRGKIRMDAYKLNQTLVNSTSGTEESSNNFLSKNNPVDSLNLGSVFFEALDYPEYARPDFYLIKQKQSVWSKGVYLTTLNEVWYACKTRIEITYRARKSKIPSLKIDEISIPMKEFIGGNNDKLVNTAMLDKLHLAVQAAGYWDLEKEKFTAFQVLSFVEYALGFIYKEFQYVAGIKQDLGFRPRTKSYFNYLIAQDAPFFDFPRFKAAIRELNLTQQNRNAFKVTLEPFQKAAHEIVILWNERIAPIVLNDAGIADPAPPELQMVEFHSADLNCSWWNNKEHFEIRPTKLYLAQDFAYYAAKISNLIMNEVLHEALVSNPNEKKDFMADLIKGIQLMQEEEIKEDLSANGRLEAPYRNSLWRWFKQCGYQAERETLKGTGHIDLKVFHPSIGTKIIECKGWWNDDKKEIIQQTCKYLTEFEDDAVIFIVNNTRKDIIPEYKGIVTDLNLNVISNFQELRPDSNSNYKYYRTIYNYNGREKTIYHFIFPAKTK